MEALSLDVVVHRDAEASGLWAHVVQLPGCFAAGHTREELEESLEAAVALYLQDEDPNKLLTSDRVESLERYWFSEAEGLVSG